jgi:transposase-like protein
MAYTNDMFKGFKDASVVNFIEKFKTDEDCKDYLAHYKWKDGFRCSKCGHTHFWPKKASPYHRVCKCCRHIEPVTSNTLFHKVEFGIRKAFYIILELSSTTQGMPAELLAKRYGINRKTAMLFTKKVRIAMKSSQLYPLKGKCEVDECVIGGKKEGKRGRGASGKMKASIVIEIEGKGIKRAYGMQIKDFPSKGLEKIPDRPIDTSASIAADKWTGYPPMQEKWQLEPKKSRPKENSTFMHRFIQQLKGWLRGIHHHVGEKHLQGYLEEYCFRFNRHLFKEAAFDKLIQRMMGHGHVSYQMIIS